MPIIPFKGAYTALVTPFKDDGSLDYEGFRKNIQFQIEQGITGILPVGTTGESPTLSTEEHNNVIKRAKKYAGNRCDILAGTGSNSTQEAIGHCKHALKSGIDRVLLVDCYYNGPSSIELRKEYYQKILDALREIKIVIYVIPGRTGTAITPEDITILSGEYDRVIAIKEATGDIARMEKERSLMPEMSIMSGDDDKTFEMMTSQKIKAAGVISVASNIAPKAVTDMVQAILEGNMEKARLLEKKLRPLFSIVTVKTKSKRILPDGREVMVEDRFRNPLAVKVAMNMLGMPAGPARPPIGKMTGEGIEVVKKALNTVYEESPEILKPVEEYYGVSIGKRLKDDSLWKGYMYIS
ncbi:MAG: 4-hydroxy-tetrahydrodipicolinate synthase [Spirochaetota bacterium]